MIQISTPKLDRFSGEQKLLVILFLPQTTKEWIKLDTLIRQARSNSVFRKALLEFIRPTAKITFETNDIPGLKLLARHLREHKFKHNFPDSLNPLCPLSLEAEDTCHFFMRCQSFSNQRNVFFDYLNSINSEILKMNENEIVQVALFGNKSFCKDMNFRVITSSIRFTKDSKRFDRFDESLSSREKTF